jgi:hypothetical protein
MTTSKLTTEKAIVSVTTSYQRKHDMSFFFFCDYMTTMME